MSDHLPRPSGQTTIPIQPKPTDTKVSHLPTSSGYVTAIRRKWNRGDVARCTLCQLCTAEADECLMQFEGYIAEEDAPLASDADYDRVELARKSIRRPLP